MKKEKKMKKEIKGSKPEKKITKKTLIADLMTVNPKKLEKVYGILMGVGLGCVGCSAAAFETIEQGCQMHGMTEKQIEEIVSKLNNAIKD